MKKVEAANFPEFEQEMLKVWDEEKTFEQSLKLREGAKRFSFYDGPPFANGLPHFGHSLVTSIKDSLGRYRTMRGYYVERRNGWDCHGLPVEFAIEKQLGISGKKQIIELGIDKFNQACRDSVFLYKGDWEDFFRRIGRWTETGRAYATIDRDYTESVWWVLSEVHRKGLLYRGYKSLPYCPRCETPLSNFELNEGYRDDVSDPSVYVKFPLLSDPETSLLAWTTTPWSLPANAALAVAEEANYVTIELADSGDGWRKGERLILAKDRLSVLDLRKAEYKLLRTQKGKELTGLSYEPLYEVQEMAENPLAYKVYLDESVSLEDGTGILHVAPPYGETDLALGQRVGLPLVQSVNGSGKMTGELPFVKNMFFKEADTLIIADLKKQNKIFAAETFTHTYPFCYRCDSPLLYFAISTWFIKVSAAKDKLLKAAEPIEWVPEHIKYGRFGKWLEGARDWAISRNRYWGAPLPIWVNEADADDYLVVSSLDELVELAELPGKPDDLHRPGIDAVIIKRDGKIYRRIEEVFDCWFESGAMPVAQQHYPFANKDVFKEAFPADYIGEGLDQTRLWFYVQHVLSTILFDKSAYRNVLVNGMVMSADGQKLSKRLQNYPPVEEVFAEEGADSLRLYLLSNDQALGGGYMRFNRDAMRDTQRNVFMTLWNVLAFFTMYAEIDEWVPSTELIRPEPEHVLDRWMLNRLDETVVQVTKAADQYYLSKAIDPLIGLVDDLSNWYVRRSRRRFGKSTNKADKRMAYETLHYTLLLISQLFAPWSPFVSDKMWRVLTEGMDMVKSVHLSDWPKPGKVDTKLTQQMQQTRLLVTEGLAQRATAGIKVRQPLSQTVYGGEELPEQLEQIAADELNVKRLVYKTNQQETLLNTEITQELRLEGLARDLIRQVQSKRKDKNLKVDDQIELSLGVTGELAKAAELHSDLIKQETLAVSLEIRSNNGDTVPIRLAGQDVTLDLNKV